MHALFLVMNLLGALGIFLYGMKLMSEALQKVAGARLQVMLNAITSNRFSAVLTGFLATTVIQSSSATTVMVVGFVSAGLLTLTQAIGVILGANIGTTITGWIVALLGFKVKITAFALPACGIGLVMTMAKSTRTRYWGEAALGFGLLFLGLALLKDSVPPVTEEQMVWIHGMSGYGIASTLLFVAIGTLLTIVLQSSSATMALTLTTTVAGYLPYEGAIAMILGENIGTTITANLASMGMQAAAKRAARAHFLFNIIGAVWAVMLMHVALLPLVDLLVPGDPVAALSVEDRTAAATTLTAHLAAFHTTFNVLNTALALPFVHQLASIVTRWVPEADDEPEWTRVTTHLSAVIPHTPGLTIAQVRHEMQHMVQVLTDMHLLVFEALTHPDTPLGENVTVVGEHERTTDELEMAIGEVLSLVTEAGIAEDLSDSIRGLAADTHRMERIGDHLKKLMALAERQNQSAKRRMSAESIAFFAEMGESLGSALAELDVYLSPEGDMSHAELLQVRVDRGRARIRRFSKLLLKSDERASKSLMLTMDAVHVVSDIFDRLGSIAYNYASIDVDDPAP